MRSLPVIAVFLPLAAAAVTTIASPVLSRRAADILAIASVAAAGLMTAAALPAISAEPLVYWFGGWEPRGGAAIGICFFLDMFGTCMALMAPILGFAAFVYSWRYFTEVKNLYHTLMLVFIGAMMAFSLSGDLFTMFVFFELMGVAAYALTAYKMEESPLEGAFNFAVTNSIGAFFILTGIALLYGRTGALNLAQIGSALAAAPPDGLVIAAFTLIVSGFITKGAIFPFHFWLADAHAVAPTPVCMMLSGIMVELGIYAVARVYWTVFSGAFEFPGESGPDSVRWVMMLLGSITAVLGGIMCFLQRHLKRLLAFSSISHMGVLLAGTAMLTPAGLAGAGIYLVSHGFIKGALFACAGIILNFFSSVDELELRGRGRRFPLTGIIFTLGGLALAGLPLFGLYAGKAILDAEAARLNLGWAPVIFFISSALTGGAVLRASGRIFLGWGPRRAGLEKLSPHEKESPETPRKHGFAFVVIGSSALFLLACAFSIGISGGIAGYSIRGAEAFQDRKAISETVLRNMPSLAGPANLSSPHKEGKWGLASTISALLLAMAALYRHNLPARYRNVFRIVSAQAAHLRRIHNGHPGDYVIWMTFGVALVGSSLLAFLVLSGAAG